MTFFASSERDWEAERELRIGRSLVRELMLLCLAELIRKPICQSFLDVPGRDFIPVFPGSRNRFN